MTMLLDQSIKIEDLIVEKTTFLNKNEIVLKIQNPIFGIGNTFGVPFQPILLGHGSYTQINETSNVLVFPVIPQYFHNFFEIFTKIIKLKLIGEKFKIAFVYSNHGTDPDKIDGVYDFFIRGVESKGPNAIHLRDFLDYINIDFICLTTDQLKNFRPKGCYLIFDNGSYAESDPFINVDNKKYYLSNFLKVPNLEISLKDIDILRNIFPTSFVSNTRKIYISRKKTWDRKYNYEDDVESLMSELGYSIVFLEDMPLLKQIRLLQTSSHIVCLYGSALVNMCLLNKDNSVLSINYTENYSVGLYEEFFKKYDIPYKFINIKNDFNPRDYLKKNIIEWENNVNKNFV